MVVLRHSIDYPNATRQSLLPARSADLWTLDRWIVRSKTNICAMCDENVMKTTYIHSYPSSPRVHRLSSPHAVLSTYHRLSRARAVVIRSPVWPSQRRSARRVVEKGGLRVMGKCQIISNSTYMSTSRIPRPTPPKASSRPALPPKRCALCSCCATAATLLQQYHDHECSRPIVAHDRVGGGFG